MTRELGDVGTRILYENDHVKTWDLVLEPGESSAWHHHTMNYLFVVTRPGTLRTDYDDGSSAVRKYGLGDVVMGRKDSIHRVTNVGAGLYSNAIVELKE